MANRKENAPAKIGTSARIRNIILAVLVLALIAAGVVYALWRSPASPLQQNTAAGTGLAVPIEIQEVTENASMNTPQYAREAISNYYTALANDDAIGTHAQRVDDELADRDLALAFGIAWTGLQPRDIGMVMKTQLG